MARNRGDVHPEKEKETKVARPQQGIGIRCPKCKGKTRVVRGTPMPDESKHGRYRKCDDCGWRVYTEETIVIEDVESFLDERKKDRARVALAAKQEKRKASEKHTSS